MSYVSHIYLPGGGGGTVMGMLVAVQKSQQSDTVGPFRHMHGVSWCGWI